MIVMALTLNNIRSFNDFKIDFSYPRRVKDSTISEEHLVGYPNFRYKKLNIVMGANASGKTSLGITLMNIVNFINNKDFSKVVDAVNNKDMESYIEMDFIPGRNHIYRFALKILPENENSFLKIAVKKVKINIRDSYQMCVPKLEINDADFTSDIIGELNKIEKFGWYFAYPDENGATMIEKNESMSVHFEHILENILKTLDPSIESVNKNSIIDDEHNAAYSIKIRNCSKVPIIHDNDILHKDILSTGTKKGIYIASILTWLKGSGSDFFYCDELFSYIQTDVEKAILSLMISELKGNRQLFFTTHNTDLLDMDLPKHSYLLMKKIIKGSDVNIEAIDASKYLTKGTESLRNAIENDLFNTTPNLDLIYEIENFGEVE